MNQNRRDNFSILFSFSIIILAIIVVHEFITPLLWAGIIALATWPLYLRIQKLLPKKDWLTSSAMMTLVVLVLIAPLVWLFFELVRDVQWFTKFLMTANQTGVPLPEWIHELPFGREYLTEKWMSTLGQPQGVATLVAHDAQGSMTNVTALLRSLGQQVAHRGLSFGFTILCLFFFYKDGNALIEHIHAMGRFFLGERWKLYSANVPGAINATVNGLVLVGLLVGGIMAAVYALVGAPAPALLGALTAVLAMIPFAVPFAFLLVAALLVTSSKIIGAAIVLAIGTLVMFVMDHFVRPVIIGGATRLPFLAVLFGILGGVKSFGILGLFLGPIIMVLFITLWHEADIFHAGSGLRS